MPPPSAERLIENIRRTLHAGIPHYAALWPGAPDGDLQDELLELSFLLGLEWPCAKAANEARRDQRRLEILLDGLSAAAREDQQATYERREAATRLGKDADAAPPVTAAVDRWLERWLSGKEAGRLP